MKKLSAVLLIGAFAVAVGSALADDKSTSPSPEAGKGAVTPSTTGKAYTKQLKSPRHKATMKKNEEAGKKGVYPEGKDQAQETMALKRNDKMKKKQGADAPAPGTPQPK